MGRSPSTTGSKQGKGWSIRGELSIGCRLNNEYMAHMLRASGTKETGVIRARAVKQAIRKKGKRQHTGGGKWGSQRPVGESLGRRKG
jgi:hypothetical protein